MTKAQSLEIEIQRRIDNFEKAVIEFSLNKTSENEHRLDMTKADLFKMIEGKL